MPTNISTTVTLTGLHCEACPRLIQKRIQKIEGVQAVRVEMGGKTEITADRVIDLGQIRNALAGTGYAISEKR